jgi:hypothetical protein
VVSDANRVAARIRALGRRGLLLLPLLLSSLVLSACGGDSSISLAAPGSGAGSAGSGASSPGTGGSSAGKGGFGASAPSTTTTPNTVVATVDPSGTVTSFLRTSQTVNITFTSNDGNPVTGLALTTDLTTLPAGWSMSSSTLPCESVSSGAVCKLTLSYTPPVATTTQTLSLGFSYVDDTSAPQTGIASIPYAPTAHDLYVVNNGNQSVTRCPVDSTGVLMPCTSQSSIGLNGAQGITQNGSTVYIPNLGDTITTCSIAPGGLSGCTDFSGGVFSPESLAVSGSNAFIVNGTGSVSRCHIGGNAMLSACTTLIIPGSESPHALLINGSTLYMANNSGNTVVMCTIDSVGALSNCGDAHSTGLISPTAMAIAGSTMYLTNYGAGGQSVTRCTIGSDGTLSACGSSGARDIEEGLAIVLLGSSAYIANNDGNVVDRCAIGADGNLSGCAVVSAAATGLSSPIGLLFY